MSPGANHERASAAVWRWRAAAEDGSAERASAARARWRGGLRGAVGLAVAALLFLWKPVLGLVAGAMALGLLAIALASPLGLQPRVERGLAAFGRAVAVTVSWITLTLVHLLVFLPLGLLLRATGRLRLDRGLDPDAATYWRPADTPRPGPRSHERQF